MLLAVHYLVSQFSQYNNILPSIEFLIYDPTMKFGLYQKLVTDFCTWDFEAAHSIVAYMCT